MPETTPSVPAGLIARGSRMFVRVAEIGEVDDRGKAVLSFGFKGRLVAEPDRPFACLVAPLIGEIVSMARYSSRDAMAADLKCLADCVAELTSRLPATEPAPDGKEARP